MANLEKEQAPITGGQLLPVDGSLQTVYGATAAPAEKGGAGAFPSVKNLLQGFRHCWLRALVLGVILSSTVSVLFWVYFPPPKPIARSMLQIPSQAPHVLFRDLAGGDYGGNYKKNQTALIKSRLVLIAALREPAVSELSMVKQQSDPVSWLERKLVIDSPGPEILTVGLPVDDERETIAIVNAVVAKYLEEIEGKERGDQKQKSDQLTSLKDKYESLLKRRRGDYKTLAEIATTSNPTVLMLKQRIIVNSLSALEKDLTTTESQVRNLSVEVALDEKKAEVELDKIVVPELAIKQELLKDGTAGRYALEVDEQERRIELIKSANPDHWLEKSKEERDKLQQAKDKLDARRLIIGPNIVNDLRVRFKLEAESRAKQGKDHLVSLKALRDEQQKDAERLEAESKSIGKQGVDLAQMKDDIDETDRLVKAITSQVQALDVESAAPARVRLVEDAQVVRPDPLKRQLAATGVSGLCTFAIIMVGLSWWEWRRLRIESPEHLAESLGVRVIGTIPRVPTKRGSRGLRPTEEEGRWDNVLLESVDSIRIVLLHLARSQSLKVVMVTSAVGGEGKTSLICQLATSLARAGRSVLLIDGDLREPCIDRLFGLPKAEGMCELLRGSETVDSAIQTTEVDNLSIIAGGLVDEEALAGLAQGELVKIFNQVRERYDFVLLDSGPVLPIADTLLMAQVVDGVLLSVMRDISRLGFIQRANERLANVGVGSLGVVMAGTSDRHEYGNKYSYKSRNKRGELSQDLEPGEVAS